MPQEKIEERNNSIIQKIIQLTQEKYVYPEIGEQIGIGIQEKLNEGKYTKLSTYAELAEQITSDLIALSNDHHWHVAHNPDQAVELIDPEHESDETQMARYLESVRKTNFGFERVERLKGNIGYLDLRCFVPSEYAGETAVAAMNFLGNCDALIIDLRQNHGGYPSMVQLITSYLFDEKPRLINTFYYRPTDDTQQFWTFPHVPGKRRPDIPVYLLISSETGSGAEEFAYNLKHMERATLIGEPTVGAAHPVSREVIAEEFIVRVPYGRPINPITGTNWEGGGVSPHISVPAEKALKTAHKKALESLIENCQNKEQQFALDWLSEIVASEYDPLLLNEDQLACCAGEYDKVRITVEHGNLVYGHQDWPVSWPLQPISTNRFHLDGDLKFDFKLDHSGTAVSVKVTGRDGRQEKVIQRTK
jgi:hypothetical protein